MVIDQRHSCEGPLPKGYPERSSSRYIHDSIQSVIQSEKGKCIEPILSYKDAALDLDSDDMDMDDDIPEEDDGTHLLELVSTDTA